MRHVISRQNQTLRSFRALADQPGHDGRLLLDGAHLVRDALRAGVRVDLAAVAASRLMRPSEEGELAETLERDGVDVVVIPDQLFDAVSPVRTPSGIVAIAVHGATPVSDICGRPGGFVLVAVDVQDPGNLGALLRVAEAGGITGALVCASAPAGAASPFSWKALRGSMGSALRLPVAIATGTAAVDAVLHAGARLIAAVPRGGADPDDIDWTGHAALAVGGEGPGLPDAMLERCDARVTIPMHAAVESLNVAAAGAILIYAGRRQRQRHVRDARLD